MNTKRAYLVVAQILFGLGLLVLLFLNVDLAQVWDLLSRSKKSWLLLSCLSILFVFYLRGTVLVLIAFDRRDLGPGRATVLNLLGGFFSNFLPSTVGGDVVKGLYLAKHFPSLSSAYAAMILQRTIGAAATLFLSCLAATTFFSGAVFYILFLILVLLCAVVGILFMRRSSSTLALAWTRRRGVSSRWIFRSAMRVLEAFLTYGARRTRLLAAFLLSIAITLVGILATFLCFLAVGGTGSFKDIFMASCLTQLSSIIPLTPGGIGVSEGTFVAATTTLGIPGAQALSTILLMRLVLLAVSLLGGVAYFLEGLPLRKTPPNA